jgi:hypothetical protein
VRSSQVTNLGRRHRHVGQQPGLLRRRRSRSHPRAFLRHGQEFSSFPGDQDSSLGDDVVGRVLDRNPTVERAASIVELTGQRQTLRLDRQAERHATSVSTRLCSLDEAPRRRPRVVEVAAYRGRSEE